MNDAKQKAALQQSMIIVAFTLLLNAAFFFLTPIYYKDMPLHVPVDKAIADARMAFAVFTIATAVTMCGHMFIARWSSHAAAIALAVVSMVAGALANKSGMTGVLPFALGVGGLVMGLLVWRSLTGSRIAWAFLVSMCFTLAVVTLFGARKIADQLDVHLWLAMTLPGVFATTGVGLAMVSGQYRERAISAA